MGNVGGTIGNAGLREKCGGLSILFKIDANVCGDLVAVCASPLLPAFEVELPGLDFDAILLVEAVIVGMCPSRQARLVSRLVLLCALDGTGYGLRIELIDPGFMR